jgi:uncharacterized protein (TIGR02246 family)
MDAPGLWKHACSLNQQFLSMKTTALVLSISAATLAGLCFGQAPVDDTQVKAAVIANDRAYEAAYAKGDSKALAGFFADDAEYTNDDGETFNGGSEIENAIRDGLLANPGSKLAINADSVRVLGPEAVLEKGSTSVTAKDGTVSGALYTAIHEKDGDKWRINTLVETPLPDMSAHDRLSELAWLVGEWEDNEKSDNVTVHSQYQWARGGNFITENITVKSGDDTTLEGWQIIGWDPVQERIRSWTFDGEGGFADGTWTRDGKRWLLRETGVTSDGSLTTADITFTKLGDDRFGWESDNRTLDGDPQPGIGRIEIDRVKGQ